MTVSSTRKDARLSCQAGFTLIELVVAVLILGILAGIAVPRLTSAAADCGEQAAVSQVLEIFRAAELFYAKHRRWPDNTDGGEFPEEFRGLLPERLFTGPAPIGRYYDWNGPGTSMTSYGVSINMIEESTKLSIDERFDDGAPDDGWITQRGSHLVFELVTP